MPTERTPEEAEAYIKESIELWKEKSLNKRVVSLSNWAESYRNKSEHALKAKQFHCLKKNIKALKKIYFGNIDCGLPVSQELQDELANTQVQLDKLIKDNPALVRKKKATKSTE
jgi:hypothetical protein